MTQPVLRPASAEEAVIRPADARDLGLIRALAHSIWPVCFKGILTTAQIDNMLGHIYSLASLQAQMGEGHRFWMAFENCRPVGYASAYKDGGTVWLKKLYLESACHGKGLGYRLMECVLSPHLPADEICLLVNSDNKAAHRFYERAGFARTGEMPVKMGDYDFTDYQYRRPA